MSRRLRAARDRSYKMPSDTPRPPTPIDWLGFMAQRASKQAEAGTRRLPAQS